MASMDKNYSRLIQISIKKDLAATIIDDILKDGYIDYQIPEDPIKDTENQQIEGYTALHIVMQHSNIEAAQRLLQHGADFTITNSIGETALHQAIIKTYFSEARNDELQAIINDILNAHVEFQYIDNPCDKNGLSHFHAACIADHEAAVRFFIQKSTSLNEPISLDSSHAPGYTPLHLAARYGRVKTFKILLEQGADMTLRNADGLSPLHMLVKRNMKIALCLEIAEVLANIEMKQEFEINREMIKSILKKCQNCKDGLLDDTGLSYFHVLCTLQNNISDIEQFILGNNVNLEHSIKSKSHLWPGYTALHFAAQCSFETVKALVKHGANIMAKDARGTTPFDLCMERFKVENVQYIVESQPDWKSIVLTDRETSLLELLDAMRSENSLEIFIQKVDMNVAIPMNSPLWSGYTPLHLAVDLAYRVESVEVHHTLYAERIRILLNAGADVNAKDSHDSTPIHTAFSSGKYNAVHLLLQTNQSIVDQVDQDDVSHLQIACAAGNVAVVRSMIRAGDVSINLPLTSNHKYVRVNEDLTTTGYSFAAGSTPLHMAVIRRNVEMTMLLVNHGADVHAEDVEGLTPIHRLLGHEYCSNVATIGNILFLMTGDLKDVTTSFGLSHLHVACWVNNRFGVEELLDQGVNINVCLPDASKLIAVMADSKKQLERLPKRRIYPLDFALCRKQSNVMDLIFRRGEFLYGEPRDILRAARYTTIVGSFDDFAETQATTLEMWEELYGILPLQVACYQFDVDAVEELLKQGADPNARVSSEAVAWSGLTPLHLLMDNPLAEERKVNAIAELLIRHGADVTLVNLKESTAIHEVVRKYGFERKETLLLLLRGQKDFDVNPGSGTRRISHFHLACILNEISIVEKFLQHGHDVNQITGFRTDMYAGCTVLHLAALFNASETVELLLKHGADVHVQNWEGDTALHCAVFYSKKINMGRGISEPLVTSLIDAGAKVNIANKNGATPLEILLTTQKPTSQLVKILSEGRGCVNLFNEIHGTGVIATAIERLTNIKSIVEHPVYQAVIDSPRNNQADKNGKTPIHNIVSIRKIAASVQVYTKAIEGFLNVGFDIDQRSKRDKTALYVAVSFPNSKAVAALLTLGANINLLCNDETPLTSHWKFCRDSDAAFLLESDRQVMKLFAKQLYKLQLINFHVDEMNLAVEAELQKHEWPVKIVDSKVVEQCQAELERLETRKVDGTDISWWSFLSETGAIASFPTIRSMERRAICDVFEKRSFRLCKEYPEFAGILHMQYRKAVARIALTEPSKNALCWLLKFNLPELCCESILRFLRNADLVNLIDVKDDPVIHVQKRRKIKENNGTNI